MSKPVATASSILRAALLATTVLGLLGSSAALARVGVTSATDGDPLGKPPAEAERVLRIGIDVQANEVIRTGANDRAHLVFLDGTALTVGPNAQLVIDKFVYDPNTKTGELAVNASKGVLRLVGGKISKTNPITITTPSSTIGIRGGICVLDVRPNNTISTFLFGNHMSVTGQCRTQEVTRPGSQVTTNAGAPPNRPTMVSQGALNAQIGQLEGTNGGSSGQGNNNSNQGGQQGGNAPNGQNTDRGVAGNSPPPGGPGGPGQLGGPTNQQQQQTVNNAINNSNQSQQVQNAPKTTTTTTTVYVSQNTLGRYLADPIYSNFNNTDLSVTPNAANNKTLPSSGSLGTTTTTTTTTQGGTSTSTSTKSRTLTLTLPGTGSGTGTITLPWQADTLSNGFTLDNMTALGMNLTNGTGYVSKNGEFFAYVFQNSGNKVGIFGGTPTAPTGTTNFPTSGVAAYTIANLGNAGALPFVDDTIGNNTSLQNAKVVSKLYTAYSTTLTQTVGQAPPDARATALQAAISISGTGANQQSYMGVFIGTFFRDIATTGGVVTTDNGVALSGSYSGTYRLGANQQVGRLVSAESTPLTGNGNAIYGTPSGDGAASAIVLTPDKLTSTASISGGLVTDVTTTRTSQASFNQPYTNLSGSDYFSATAAYATTTPSGVGTNRTTQTLNGFVGGVVDSVDSSGNTFASRSIATSDPTALTLSTNATNNRASATVNVANWDGSTSASFQLGGTTGSNNASSAFIDNQNYAVRDRTADIGNTTSIAGSSANVTSNTTMVSYNVAPAANLFSNAGVTPCTCSFLTWGWWGGDISYSNNSTYNPGGRDRLNFATYVAGTLSTASDINALSSTATYNGHMVGNVNSNGSSYVAAGSYQNVWSFGNRSGAVTASFDGTTYGSNVTANTVMTGGVTFGTNGSPITSGGKSLTLNGAFFSGGSGNPVAGQAGSFAISGTNYKAGGTFAAQK